MSDSELAAVHARRVIADEPEYPSRVSMAHAAIGPVLCGASQLKDSSYAIKLPKCCAQANLTCARMTTTASSTSYDRLKDFLTAETLAALDLFDRLQLNAATEVGRGAKSLSDAGHRLAASSRASRTSTNNADRLRKYLARFQLSWSTIVSTSAQATGIAGVVSVSNMWLSTAPHAEYNRKSTNKLEAI